MGRGRGLPDDGVAAGGATTLKAPGCPRRRGIALGESTMNRALTQALIAAAAIALAAAVLAQVLFAPSAGVLPENVARITPGMTPEQVEAIIGGPPRRLVWEPDEQGKPARYEGVWYGKPSERRRGYQR